MTMALTARGKRDTNPIFHTVDDPPPRYSRTGHTFRARCGTQVRYLLNYPLPFARPCKKCEEASPHETEFTGGYLRCSCGWVDRSLHATSDGIERAAIRHREEARS